MPAKSKSQQRLFGQVHKCKKEGSCSSDKVKEIASSISDKDAKDFAKTKHKGLPDKVEKPKSRFSSFKEHLDKMEETFADRMDNTTVRGSVQRRIDQLNRSSQTEKNYIRQSKAVWDVIVNSQMPPNQVMRIARAYVQQYKAPQQ